jgi:cytochrome c peroxidase
VRIDAAGVVTALMMLLSAARGALPPPPLGLDLYMPVPDGSPMTRELVNQGRRLFHDKPLSRDRSSGAGHQGAFYGQYPANRSRLCHWIVAVRVGARYSRALSQSYRNISGAT